MNWLGQIVKDFSSPSTTQEVKTRRQKAGAIVFVVICLIGFILYIFGSEQMKEDEPKSQASIALIQHFCGPGYQLGSMIEGQDWRQDGNWTAIRYSLPVSDENGEINGHDIFEVVYRVSVMDGLDKKTIEAEWLVDLTTKHRSPRNTEAQSLFICY